MPRLVFCATTIALVCLSAAAFAHTVTVSAGSQLGVTINSADPVVVLGDSAAVRGRVMLTPSVPMPEGVKAVVVDGVPKLMTDASLPEYTLDTSTLSDGMHEVRIDAAEGELLLASTGAVALHVYNASHDALFRQAPTVTPSFFKLQRKVLLREIAWFNNREGDLEKHGFIRNGRVYITLTDLMRHIGGGIIWGPKSNYIEVHRNNMVVRVIPGSARIYVDGNRRSLGRSAIRMENRTYVPLRPMCELFGIGVDWNHINNRAFVNFAG